MAGLSSIRVQPARTLDRTTIMHYLRRTPAGTRSLAVLLPLLLTSCGLFSDDPAWYERVAGRYTGPLYVTFEGASTQGFMELTVTQKGRDVTIDGALTIYGQILPIEPIPGRISDTGAWTPLQREIEFYESDEIEGCGSPISSSASTRFAESGRLTMTETYNYGPCGNFVIFAPLER